MLATPASTAARAPSSPCAWHMTGMPCAEASSTIARSCASVAIACRGSVLGRPARPVAAVLIVRTPFSAFTRTSIRRSSSLLMTAGIPKKLSEASRPSPRPSDTRTPDPR